MLRNAARTIRSRALGDTESRLASPWGVIPNEGFDRLTDRISEVTDRDEVEQIVVGLPRPLSDPASENEQVREVREFGRSSRARGWNRPVRFMFVTPNDRPGKHPTTSRPFS